MNDLITVTLLYENNILPGKKNTKFNLETKDNYLSLTNIKTNAVTNLYFNNIDNVELGIYKKNLLFQCTYLGEEVVFYPSVKDWKSEKAKNMLRMVNKYTPILDPIKYYKAILVEPKILKKKDFASTSISTIIDDLVYFNDLDDYVTSKDLQIMDINLRAFLIKRLIEEKEDKRKIEEINDLLRKLDEYNGKFNNELLALTVYYDIFTIKYIKPEEMKPYIEKGKKDVQKLLSIDDSLINRLLKVDVLFNANLLDETLANKDEIDYMIQTLNDCIKKTDDTSFYIDLSTLIATYFSVLGFEFNEEKNLEYINLLIDTLTVLIERRPYHLSYAILGYGYGLKTHYYSLKEDLIETKNNLLKEEEYTRKAIELSKLPPKHFKGPFLDKYNYATINEIDKHRAQLVEILIGKAQVANSYQNTFEQLKNLEEAVKIYDDLVTKKFYKEENDEKIEGLIDLYNILVYLEIENNCRDLDFLEACYIRFYVLTKYILEKKETKELYEHLIDSSNGILKILLAFERDNNDKFKYLDDMLKGADGVLKFDKENSKAYDAKLFCYYFLFEDMKDKDKIKAKEMAINARECYNHINDELKQMDEYNLIINALNKFIEEN